MAQAAVFGDAGEARGGARAFHRGASGAAEARAARRGRWLLGERRMNAWMWKGGSVYGQGGGPVDRTLQRGRRGCRGRRFRGCGVESCAGEGGEPLAFAAVMRGQWWRLFEGGRKQRT